MVVVVVGGVVVVGAAVVAGVVVVEGTSVDVETVESEPLPQAKIMSMIARYMASTLMVRVCHPPRWGGWGDVGVPRHKYVYRGSPPTGLTSCSITVDNLFSVSVERLNGSV